MDNLTPEEVKQQEILAALIDRCAKDFPFFARKQLKVATKKGGELAPLILNKSQLYVHDRIEAQLYEDGQVRALILKGRQQGISTYAEGRFYWKTRFRKMVNAFILTHLQEATDNLFAMVERYHANLHPMLKPETVSDNAKELIFKHNGSGYKVSTAGSKATGRSRTVHYCHGSEVAFWSNADTHAAGLMQAVPIGEDTEIIYESTANGVGGYFHELWQKAEAGESEFIAIFVPWYWQDEYRKTPPKGWQASDTELTAQETFGLDNEQLYWAHQKNIELGGDVGEFGWLFLQEYPFTAADAFQASGQDTICSPQKVSAARRRDPKELSQYGAHVMGVDPSRYGGDRSSIIHRRGKVADRLKSYKQTSITELAGLVAVEVDACDKAGDYVDAIFVDEVGLGAGVVDALNDMGYRDRVIPVNAGSRATDFEQYFNLRCEMWDLMGKWFEEDVAIPDVGSLHADLIAPSYTYNVKQQKVLETKEQMKKRGIRSPDEAEALALTFARPIRPKHDSKTKREPRHWRTI